MSPQRIILIICMAASSICIAAGYAFIGQWIGVALTFIAGIIWLYARKYPSSDLPEIGLVLSVGLATAGLLWRSQAVLMLCGSCFALASWDLVSLADELQKSSNEIQTKRFENKRLHSLMLALGGGLAPSLAGRLLHFQINFVVLLIFVGLVILGLDQIWLLIKERSYNSGN